MSLGFFVTIFLIKYGFARPLVASSEKSIYRETLISPPFLVITPNDALDNKIESRYKCEEQVSIKNSSFSNDFHFRGTSLGGWLVLEPWITPSLFYQFLGAFERFELDAKDHIALDSKTFCSSLGPQEANRQLQIHWNSWVTEEQIANLATIGIKHLRIPVADWMFETYPPYTSGCWDGAINHLNRVLALCEKYSIKVLLDVHTARGSQNGLDNSGDSGHLSWVGNMSYSHWNMRGGDWSGQLTAINETNLLHSLRVVAKIVELYNSHPVIIGLTPINEPWEVPWPILQEFYWRSYQLVRLDAPHWLTLLHDSYRLTTAYWGGNFLSGCSNYAVDTHIYQAWEWFNDVSTASKMSCQVGKTIAAMESAGVAVVVGEWSLATDNCAMWLNGLNDNVPGYPKVTCDRVKCPDPYFEIGSIPNAPPDPSKSRQDPFGLGGDSFVEFGTCPIDKAYGSREQDDLQMKRFAAAELSAYDRSSHGFFFWNFRTELESRWDFQVAVRRGWLPTDWASPEVHSIIQTGCDQFNSSHDSPRSSFLARVSAASGFYMGSVLLVVLVSALVFLRLKFFRGISDYHQRNRYEPIPTHDQGNIQLA